MGIGRERIGLMEKESGDWCRNKQTHKQERVGVIEGGHRSVR